MSDLDLVNLNCSFTRLQYEDPHYPGTERDVIVVRGPTSFVKREAIFLHFSLEDETRDFFTVSYFVFPGYDAFNVSNEQGSKLVSYHRVVPTFALSSGLRMWIKLIMSEAMDNNTSRTEFRVEYGDKPLGVHPVEDNDESHGSNEGHANTGEGPDKNSVIAFNLADICFVKSLGLTTSAVPLRTVCTTSYSVVKFWDRRSAKQQKKHLFFIFFEWKNNIIEQSVLLYTTTPWSIGAGLCGVFLTIHRGFQLAQVAYRKFKKEKRRRTIRKQTLRELKQKQLEAEAASC
ncbi:hypothetical protein NP493_874g01006 [Ridgeia piscesae]|uniref:Proton-activated chloride channel n=1 Tax=Ridgeia piscesae TaxID=27915 RepID=A0AAD9KLG4_RIDPI|nr:hypothetical protein NP493_874g01006 [Ridgeia piscesae]